MRAPRKASARERKASDRIRHAPAAFRRVSALIRRASDRIRRAPSRTDRVVSAHRGASAREREASDRIRQAPAALVRRASARIRRAASRTHPAAPAPAGTPTATPGTPTRRTPRPLRTLLACLPGLAAVAALPLCAAGVDHAVTARQAERAARPSAARPVAPAHTAPRPRIVPRSAWLDRGTTRRQPPPRYDDKVVAVFVHHTDSPNGYDCADAPRIIRDVYTGQTGARDWDDIGYNFLVDRCGTIYEGRAGGVERPVTGAHTQGFNHRSAGVAALGTFTAGVPVPQPMIDAIAALAAWKLGLSGVDPRTTVRLTSSNSLSRYAAGTTADLPALAGHDDGYMTSCPGAALIARLPEIRGTAARLQGRPTAAVPSGSVSGTLKDPGLSRGPEGWER